VEGETFEVWPARDRVVQKALAIVDLGAERLLAAEKGSVCRCG
jgi:hypothetical protein